jgi:hypothetical protein
MERYQNGLPLRRQNWLQGAFLIGTTFGLLLEPQSVADMLQQY